ncbi:Cdc6/Cdc18 family protein [Halocatena halophila]|uniref:Cdc6/Cdc18 family protein n=1 Tax=Halocatena halophila TaxID=2814576 RepID=UPI002ED0EBE0
MDLFNTETESIFKRRDTLQDGFVPDDLAGNTRDEEMQMLATALQPVIHGNSPDNVILRGPNGSGKTAAVRIVLDILSHEISQIEEREFSPIIVNGSQHNTGYQLTRDLANRLHRDKEFKQGHSTSSLLDVVADGIASLPGIVVIAIDELSDIDDIDKLLYLLTRSSSHEKLNSTKLGVLATTTNNSFKEELSSDVVSTLGQRTISFEPYTADDLQEILWHRVEQAFEEGTVDQAAVSLCAALASRQGGDARFALDILKMAGDISSQTGHEQVTVDQIEAARDQWDAERTKTLVTSVPLKKRQVICAFAELAHIEGCEQARTKQITERYKRVAERSKSAELVSGRMVDRYLRSFVDTGLLESELHQHSEGTWRTYRFEFSVENVLSALKTDFHQQRIAPHDDLGDGW